MILRRANFSNHYPKAQINILIDTTTNTTINMSIATAITTALFLLNGSLS